MQENLKNDIEKERLKEFDEFNVAKELLQKEISQLTKVIQEAKLFKDNGLFINHDDFLPDDYGFLELDFNPKSKGDRGRNDIT